MNQSLNLAGLRIGHATDVEYHTGCTVFLCPPETVGSVDARGPAPGSRELTLLELDKPIQFVNAVLLTGGSAFGLAAADGVMRYLGERNIGHWTPIRPIPIVPAAVVYDLFFSGGQRLPDAEMGYAACLDAREEDIAQGNVGAGAGVTVGKWGGRDGFMKGGFGLACVEQEGVIVGAAAVVNAVGDVVNEDGTVLAGARKAEGGWLADEKPFRPFAARPPAQLTNTTLVVVWTNARLTKVEANRLAQRAHDGLAIAIRPVHTTHDGDTAFALATGQVEANFDLVANTAVHATTEAIRNAVRFAHSVGEIPGLAS
ncbi:MAG: P1 family peptidase [Chloroflexi bacterium]|nr:P1 family peptidase [Ardenticatenaceae bacterium]MBL1127466.1 peptidase S58 family protein [Chloroflexota bacterium]NOG33530.1 P1 family peptidase [Chloroflexota bacterium]